MLHFLRAEVPSRWGEIADSITDNFRIIRSANFRILAERSIHIRIENIQGMEVVSPSIFTLH
jgi:hypothetical protein